MHLKLEGGPSNNGFMKCVAHVQFVIKSPWDFGGGCQRMQKSLFMTMRKAMHTKLQWLNGNLHTFFNLIWFLCLDMFKILFKKNMLELLHA